MGHTRLSEIEQDAGVQATSYLANLEKNYELVKKVLPIELGRFEALREKVSGDLDVLNGLALERYFFFWKFVELRSH